VPGGKRDWAEKRSWSGRHVGLEQSKNSVEALARGTPDAGQIALGKLRELI
jgi:hypothetical protein